MKNGSEISSGRRADMDAIVAKNSIRVNSANVDTEFRMLVERSWRRLVSVLLEMKQYKSVGNWQRYGRRNATGSYLAAAEFMLWK